LFFSFLPKIEGAKIRWRDNKSDSIAGQAGQLVFGTGANFDVGNA
jgi:hypothetical protein